LAGFQVITYGRFWVITEGRAQAERLVSLLRGVGTNTFVSHSSLSVDERRQAERAFRESRDCVIVATSTLELGIDIGDLDRVLQLEALPSSRRFPALGPAGTQGGSEPKLPVSSPRAGNPSFARRHFFDSGNNDTWNLCTRRQFRIHSVLSKSWLHVRGFSPVEGPLRLRASGLVEAAPPKWPIPPYDLPNTTAI
jgi:hypothetical protein